MSNAQFANQKLAPADDGSMWVCTNEEDELTPETLLEWLADVKLEVEK